MNEIIERIQQRPSEYGVKCDLPCGVWKLLHAEPISLGPNTQGHQIVKGVDATPHFETLSTTNELKNML
jgi:hypothetical protein